MLFWGRGCRNSWQLFWIHHKTRKEIQMFPRSCALFSFLFNLFLMECVQSRLSSKPHRFRIMYQYVAVKTAGTITVVSAPSNNVCMCVLVIEQKLLRLVHAASKLDLWLKSDPEAPLSTLSFASDQMRSHLFPPHISAYYWLTMETNSIWLFCDINCSPTDKQCRGLSFHQRYNSTMRAII